MSGGGRNQTVTQHTEPPAWAVPYFQGYLDQGARTANLPYQPYTGQRAAPVNPTQQAAYTAVANRAMQGTPEQTAGRDALTRTVSGGYLGAQAPTNEWMGAQNEQRGATNPYAGSNPYLQQQIDAAQGDVVRNFNLVTAPAFGAASVRSGSLGNTGLAEMENEARRQMAGELGRISSGMRFQDYTTQQGLAENALNRGFQSGENYANRLFQGGETLANRRQAGYEAERGRMMASLGLVPQFAGMDYLDANALLGVGDALQQQQQQQIDADYANFAEARDDPIRRLDIIGRTLGGANYGQQMTGTQPGPNRALGALGGAATGALLASMLGGAGGGAAAGAAAGSVVPGWGTLIGAGLGGLLGLMR